MPEDKPAPLKVDLKKMRIFRKSVTDVLGTSYPYYWPNQQPQPQTTTLITSTVVTAPHTPAPYYYTDQNTAFSSASGLMRTTYSGPSTATTPQSTDYSHSPASQYYSCGGTSDSTPSAATGSWFRSATDSGSSSHNTGVQYFEQDGDDDDEYDDSGDCDDGETPVL
jgi:hypothetical protein